MNPNSLKNLRPFKLGQSGNPNGRPKRQPFTDRLAVLVETPIEEKDRKKLKLPKGATYAEAMVLAIVRRAIKGDIRAFKEICDRVEGKPGTRIEDEDRSIAASFPADEGGRVPRGWMKREVTDINSGGNVQGESEQSSDEIEILKRRLETLLAPALVIE